MKHWTEDGGTAKYATSKKRQTNTMITTSEDGETDIRKKKLA